MFCNGVDDADLIRPRTPGDLGARKQVHFWSAGDLLSDTPAVEDLQRGAEDSLSLLEEGAQLVEVAFVAGDVYLLGVGGDLPEVGVQRHVEGEVAGEPVFQVHAHVGEPFVDVSDWIGGVAVVLLAARFHIRHDLQVVAAPQAHQVFQVPVLVDPGPIVAPPCPPRQIFFGTLDITVEVDPERLRLMHFEAEDGEGDGDFREPALIGDGSG